MRIWEDGAWRLYWGSGAKPDGYAVLGVIERHYGDSGALMVSDTGMYVQGNAGSIRLLRQQEVIAELRKNQRRGALA